MTSDGVDCVSVSITITGIPKAPRAEAEQLEMKLLCMVSTSNLLEDYGFLRSVSRLVVAEFVFLDTNTCPCNLSRKFA